MAVRLRGGHAHQSRPGHCFEHRRRRRNCIVGWHRAPIPGSEAGLRCMGAGVEHSPADCKGEHRDDLCQSKKVGESFDSLNTDASRSNCSSKVGGPGITGSPNLDYSTLILANHLFGTALLSNDGILPSASYGCSLIL